MLSEIIYVLVAIFVILIIFVIFYINYMLEKIWQNIHILEDLERRVRINEKQYKAFEYYVCNTFKKKRKKKTKT